MYPIAIDNDFAIWRAFGNDARPAKYLFDDRGRLVRRWIAEGSYDEIEREIRRLLITAQPGSQLPAVTALGATVPQTRHPYYAGITNAYSAPMRSPSGPEGNPAPEVLADPISLGRQYLLRKSQEVAMRRFGFYLVAIAMTVCVVAIISSASAQSAGSVFVTKIPVGYRD